MHVAGLVTTGIFACALASGQKPEFDFYREFRNSIVPQLRTEDPSVSEDRILDRYAAKLEAAAIPKSEIARRVKILRSERPLLEADYWNRFYLDGKSNFNRAPNSFLVQVVQGKVPGTALDYSMGEGRMRSIWPASAGKCPDLIPRMPQWRLLKAGRRNWALN